MIGTALIVPLGVLLLLPLNRFERLTPKKVMLLPYVTSGEYPTMPGVSEPLGHGVYVHLVEEQDGRCASISLDELKRRSLTIHEARRNALHHLEEVAAQGCEAMEERVGESGNRYLVLAGHWLASTCLLSSRVQQRASQLLGTDRFLAAIPDRETLILFPEGDVAEHERMRTIVREATEEADKPITSELFLIEEGRVDPFVEQGTQGAATSVHPLIPPGKENLPRAASVPGSLLRSLGSALLTVLGAFLAGFLWFIGVSAVAAVHSGASSALQSGYLTVAGLGFMGIVLGLLWRGRRRLGWRSRSSTPPKEEAGAPKVELAAPSEWVPLVADNERLPQGFVVRGRRYSPVKLRVGSADWVGEGRVRIEDCEFKSVRLFRCFVGSAVFKRCTFDGVRSDFLSTYDALFLECRLLGKIDGVNFGIMPEAHMPEWQAVKEAIEADNERLLRSTAYCLDVRNADLVNARFLGERLASKVLFRRGQCLLYQAPDLRSRLDALRNKVRGDEALMPFFSEMPGAEESLVLECIHPDRRPLDLLQAPGLAPHAEAAPSGARRGTSGGASRASCVT